MADVAGKVVIVTGGGRGIGLALVQYLAAKGASLVVAEYDRQAIRDGARARVLEMGQTTGSRSDMDYKDGRPRPFGRNPAWRTLRARWSS